MPSPVRCRLYCALPLLAALGFAPIARAQFVHNGTTATMTGGGDSINRFDVGATTLYIQNGGGVTWGAFPGVPSTTFFVRLTSLNYQLNSGDLVGLAPIVQVGPAPGDAGGSATIRQSGGAATFGSLEIGTGGSGYVLSGGTLQANILFRGRNDSWGSVQLTGGVLTASDISSTASSGNINGYLLFSGGTLRAGARSPGDENWINSNNHVLVSTGGAKIDTAGYNRTINAAFLHDDGGAAIDGGFTKLGEGTLTITSALSHTGTTRVEGGTLLLNRAGGATITNSSGLVVNSGTLVLGQSNLTVGGPLSGAGGAINLNNWTLAVDQSANGTYAGNIEGAGGRFTKVGGGTLVLSGTNTYTGSTEIGAGTVQYTKTASFAAGGSFQVNSGAMAGFNVGGAGEFTWSQISGYVNASFLAGSLVGLDTSNAAGGSYAISQNITNAGGTRLIGFVKQGGGTLVLSGSNSYTGGTHVIGGTLQFAKTSALSPTGGLVVDAGATGAFNVGGAGEFTWAGISAVTAGFQNGSWVGLDTTNAGGSFTLSNSIAGGFGLTKLGTGTLVLSGSNSFTGGMRVNDGLVQFASANNLGAVSGTVALDGGGLRWATGNTADISSRLNLGAGGGTIDTNGNTVTFANAISGTGALIKTGSGFLRLTSANSHSGDTTVNGGVIVLAGPATTRGQLGGLDGSKITINSGNINLETDNAVVGTNPFGNILLTINAGGLLSTDNNTTILPEVLLNGGVIDTAGGGNFTSGNYIFSDGLRTAGTGTLSRVQGGAVVLPTAVNVLAGDTLRISSVIMGNNNLVKQGTGSLVLTGTNTFSGTTVVGGGVVDFNNASAFGNAAGAVAMNSGTLRWTGNTADLSSRLTLGAGGGTFDTNGNTVTFASAISGTGALIKTGSGLLRLTSANSHSGDTTVNGGVIVLAGPTSTRGQLGGLDGSKITINSGNINLESNNAVVGTTPFANITLTINTGGLLSTVNNTTILPEVVMNGGTIETASGGDFVNGNYIFSDGLSTAGTGRLSSIQGGTVILPTAVNVGAGDTLRMAVVIMGNNNLVKNGTGTMLLTGSNTFTGSTLVNGGLIEFSNASAFGNAANKVTLNGGGLRWAAGNTTDISGRLNAFGAGGATFDTGTNTVTLASVMSGSGALTKSGAGTLRLTAANTYTGGTVITEGLLTAAHDNALGSGVVQVTGSGALYVQDAVAFTNDVVLSGGSYSRVVSGNIAGKVNATSDLAGGIDTTARILAGNVLATSTLTTWFSATSAATNDSFRESDVYSFLGTGTNTFVLELSSVSLDGGTLGWLSNGMWVNAIDGNTGNTATAAMQGFDGSYAEFLAAFGGVSLSQSIGAYGYDQETHAAWAVLNHNSDFAVIPEPATAALLVLGGVALLARRRRA